MPTPSQQHTNQLAREKSPYLLQHAHNPVNWYAWGDEAFQKAKTENKPIFLSIGYATCHWCHVMERESFENEDIAKVMNENFINIKVDREERPDIDQIYMTAVQAMTGGGGWPLSVFLTPDLEPFFGGTYFAPDELHGRPGFSKILEEIAHYWQHENEKVTASGKELAQLIQQGLKESPGKNLDEDILKKFYHQSHKSFDPKHGGFGEAPKFPRSETISLLLRIYRRTGETKALEMAEKTLNAMAKGGIYDHLGGGFARYATDELWLIPHFEKMLYDNALLARTYLEAYQVTQNEDWINIAKETLDYVLRDMTSEQGGFYSAEDADSEGEEGKFYTWSEAELKELLDEDEFKEFKSIFPLSLASQLEGKFVLHMGSDIAWKKRYAPALQEILKKLYAHRSKRVRPLLDDKVLASWNGLMISAMAQAYSVLGDKRYLNAAQRAATFIMKTLWDGKTLLRRYRDGEARYNGSLDDYAFMIAALLNLYEADFDSKWFRLAVALQDRTDALFRDTETCAYYYTDASDATLLTRTKELYDGAVPSGNSVTALNLLRLYHYTMNESYRQKGDELLKAVSGRLSENPQIAPALLLAVDFATDDIAEIVIAGMKSDAAVQDILNRIEQQFLPNKVLALADFVEADVLKLLPLLVGQIPQGEKATIFVCKNHSCQQPVTIWNDAEKLLSAKHYSL